MKESSAHTVQAPGPFNRIFGAGGRAARSWPARYLALAVLLVAGATFGGVFAVANAQEADGAISGLTLTSDSPGTLAVSWDAPDTSPSDYRVNWARADEGYPAWTSDEGNRHPEGTSVELTGLDQDVEYKVRVRARYHKGEYADDPWSGPWADARLTVAGDPEEEPTPTPTPTPTATPEPSPTPLPRGTISGLALSSDEPGSLSIAWNAPDLAPTDYRVVWAPVDDGFPSWKDDNTADKGNSYPDGDATSLTVSGLPQGAETKVMVRARYHDGDHAGSPWSGPWTGETTQRVRGAAPAAPAAVAVTVAEEDGGTLVRLIWLAPEHDALTGYRIWRGPDADSLAVLVEDTGSTATTYDDATVAAGESYHYAVAALSLDGTGARAVSSEVVVPEPETSEPLSAQQQNSGETLVSNLGQLAEATVLTSNSSFRHAQSFFVGSAPPGFGYRIDSVKVVANRRTTVGTVQPSASVYSDDNGAPGTSLFTLELPPGFPSTTSPTRYTLSAPSGRVLSGPNRYWVVFANASSNIVELHRTASTNEDQQPPPAGGWSIGDRRALSASGGSWSSQASPMKMAVLGAPTWPRDEPAGEDFPGADDLAHTTTGIVTPGVTSSGELTSGVDTLSGQEGDYWWLGVEPGRSYRVEVSFGGSTSLGTGGSAWPHFIEDGDTRPSSCCDPDHNRDDGLTFVHVDPPKRGVQGIVKPDRRYMLFVASYDKLNGDDSATYTGAYTITLTDITGVEMVVSNLDPQSDMVSLTLTTYFSGEADSGRTYAVAFTTGSHAGGYRLDRVKASFDYSGLSQPRLALWANRSNTRLVPWTKLCDLRNPEAHQKLVVYASGAVTPTFLAGDCASQNLAASTTYWIVFIQDGPNIYGLRLTSENEVSYGSGWSITDAGVTAVGGEQFSRLSMDRTVPVEIWASER